MKDAANISRRSFIRAAATAVGCLSGIPIVGCSKNSARPASPGAGIHPLTGKRVGISSLHEVEILNEFFSDMKREAQLPGNQLDLVIVDAGNDAVKQMNDIEAFIVQKYDGIFFLALPSDGLDQLVAKAVRNGVFMFNHAATPVTGCTQNVILAQHSSGAEIGKFAARWINEKHGGQAEVGVITNASDPWLQIRTEGIKDGLRENAPHARVVGEVHGHSIELGAAAAANLLQAHPDIKVLLSHADDPGYGCYTAATEAGKKDPNEFMVASCDGTRLVMDKIGENGIYQATWSYLFPFSATAWMRDMITCLRGGSVPPTRTQVGRLVTNATLPEVRAMTRDPLAPEVQKYYGDPTVMFYSNDRLTSPKG
jgi:ABC-type sugar transport system substrate-binding protein